MKANELRIGNYIYIDSRDELRTIVEIRHTMVSVKYIRSDTNQPHQSMVEYDRLTPITLTEEWLFKFKWKYQDRDINRSDGKKERFYISPFFGEHREYWIELQLSNNSFGHSFMWLCCDIGGGNDHIHFPQGHKIDYVHQLQNIFFALAGEEPTLKTELSQKER